MTGDKRAISCSSHAMAVFTLNNYHLNLLFRVTFWTIVSLCKGTYIHNFLSAWTISIVKDVQDFLPLYSVLLLFDTLDLLGAFLFVFIAVTYLNIRGKLYMLQGTVFTNMVLIILTSGRRLMKPRKAQRVIYEYKECCSVNKTYNSSYCDIKHILFLLK